MQIDGINVLRHHRTAQYVAVNNARKDLALAMADMSILESSNPETIEATWLSSLSRLQSKPKCVVVDANWTTDCLHTWLRYARSIKAITIFEPVSIAKSARLFAPASSSNPAYDSIYPNHLVDVATPNSHELTALHDAASQLELFSHPAWFRVIDALGISSAGLRVPLSITTSPELVDLGIPQQAIKLLPFIPTLLTKLGEKGVLLTKLIRANDPVLNSPEEAQYVLSRCSNGDEEVGVGGLYVRLFPPERILGEGGLRMLWGWRRGRRGCR